MNSNDFTVRCDRAPQRSGIVINAFIADRLCQDFQMEILTRTWEQITKRIADEYFLRYGDEILAQIDQRAVANVAVATAGAQIAKSLQGTNDAINELIAKAVYRG